MSELDTPLGLCSINSKKKRMIKLSIIGTNLTNEGGEYRGVTIFPME
jgi:hypothetical protein